MIQVAKDATAETILIFVLTIYSSDFLISFICMIIPF